VAAKIMGYAHLLDLVVDAFALADVDPEFY
jgi:hypothetical protein